MAIDKKGGHEMPDLNTRAFIMWEEKSDWSDEGCRRGDSNPHEVASTRP